LKRYALHLLVLLTDHESGGNTFLQKIGKLLEKLKVTQIVKKFES
jgi:hypothetical protein